MLDSGSLDILSDLLTCGDELYTWKYNANLELLKSNCPQEFLLDTLFQHCDFRSRLFEHARFGVKPLILSVSLGLVWIAAFEKTNGNLQAFHVIGPAFAAIVPTDKIVQIIGESYPADVSLAWKWEFIKLLENLPTVSSMILTRYALMLHYCVTGEKLAASDISMLRSKGLAAPDEDGPTPELRDVWMVEEELMQKVRTGDLQFRQALNRATILQGNISMQMKDPLRQTKNMAISFVSLCTRAAIEGGLPPEQAYILGNVYINDIEACRSPADVAVLDNAMFADFIRRVHSVRLPTGLTRQIRACCQYIDFHIEEKLDLDRLAAHVSYTPYYLSRKFKEEMGLSINDYIRWAKIERAKILLTSTEDSILAISERLNFNSRSFFADTFRAVAGVTPALYRTENQKL